MDAAQLAELRAWIIEAGLAGESEMALVSGLCARLTGAGMPLAVARVFVDTLHPVHEGRMFRWERQESKAQQSEYGRQHGTDDAGDRWKRSPFYHMLQTGQSLLRRRLTAATEQEFSVFPELRADGITDYVAMITRFGAEHSIGEMDCMYSSWMASGDGFSDE